MTCQFIPVQHPDDKTWRALCSCGWISSLQQSLHATEAAGIAHAEEG